MPAPVPENLSTILMFALMIIAALIAILLYELLLRFYNFFHKVIVDRVLTPFNALGKRISVSVLDCKAPVQILSLSSTCAISCGILVVSYLQFGNALLKK